MLDGVIAQNLIDRAGIAPTADRPVSDWPAADQRLAADQVGVAPITPVPVTPPAAPAPLGPPPVPSRVSLPATRQALTHRFTVGGHEGYITVGLYPDGRPGELFVTMSKAGSTLAGLVDAVAIGVSIGLQYGIPLKVFIDKYSFQRFEPAGCTGNPELPMAVSILDYIFRWLALRFGGAVMLPDKITAMTAHLVKESPTEVSSTVVVSSSPKPSSPPPPPKPSSTSAPDPHEMDAPPCPTCGAIMQRTGHCHACKECGTTGGCS